MLAFGLYKGRFQPTKLHSPAALLCKKDMLHKGENTQAF